ncbi:glycosyl hydrolase family 18 protein [Bacillus salitolerans]|uniref:Glycosyl hydrolase family 18 protein n=1 Tax=Bacillus salitolerans TaxID=1437434 RepID=A0ABW4LT82_9BACI
MFQSYRIVKKGEEYELILFIDQQSTEFSSEFGSEFFIERSKDLKGRVEDFVKERLPQYKINSVKVMVGTMLVATLALTSNPEAPEAAVPDPYINMSYLYFGNTNMFISQVERTKGNLNYVAPSYFDISTTGDLILTDKFNPVFIEEMHKKGIKVTPFLSNHWSREIGRAGLANREKLSTQIAAAIEKYNLDGVNVDIENVTDADRAAYTDFVRLLREKVPAHKQISVAVAANPNGWTKGWHGSYDYKELAKYSDYLMIMSYDESYPGGPEGPIASLPWVEMGIQYALAQGVPGDKIVIGLPFFGRYWIEGEARGGNGLSQERIEQLINKYESKVVYDSVMESPKAIVTIKQSDPVTTINGVPLKPGVYHIWFENERSIEKKVRLVKKYGLRGTGSWALGQEDTDIWNDFQTWLVGNVPVDSIVPAATTDYEGSWAKEFIDTVRIKGWMKGVTETTFNPNGQLTRQQAALVLTRMLQLEEIETIPKNGYFSDVHTKDAEAQRAIAIMKQYGYFQGDSEGKFRPGDPITREQMAVVLHRILEDKQGHTIESSLTSQPFKDISTTRYSYKATADLNALGILSGYDDGTFQPTKPITRAQMAKLLALSVDQLIK